MFCVGVVLSEVLRCFVMMMLGAQVMAVSDVRMTGGFCKFTAGVMLSSKFVVLRRVFMVFGSSVMMV